MWIESAIVVALLSVQGQQTTKPAAKVTEPPTREALAALLAASHNKGAKLPKMESFKATLIVAPMGRDVDNVAITIDSKFRKDVPKNGRRTRDMIRYSVDEGGKKLERGCDAYGYWFRTDGKVTALEGRDFPTDRQKVRQEISLAKQLLSVVDPATILDQLEGRVAVAEDKLPLGQGLKTTYWVATGTLQDYPFYTLPQDAKKPRKARVSLYVDKKSGILKAVQASHRPTGNSELVLFGEYSQYPLTGTHKTEVMLPTKLKISQGVGGKYKPLVNIEIRTVALNPQLTAADFLRGR